MPEEGRRNLVFRDAASVVRDADQADPAVADLHRDPVCAGINGIFRQFLDHGRGPLHDLSCRDLVYGRFIQYLYLLHPFFHLFFSLFCSR